ncbi:MAG: pitrilysin family protein [Kiloniellales bacterium]|nr:pitrilysin family protein [Kiloniellales bacterium]
MTSGTRAILQGLAAVVALALVAVQPAKAVEVQRVVSPGGIEAWLVEDHSNPIIAVELAFRDGGSVIDPEGREGLANMVSGLIDEGAGELDSRGFRREMENRSISLSFTAGLDRFFGGVQTLTKHRDKAFDLLRLALTEPRFDEEPVERIRSQILARLARDSEDADTIAILTMRRLLLPDHPYRRPLRGTAESVGGITRDDLVAYTRRIFSRDRLVVGVSGDITPEDLADLLDETFLGLPATGDPIEVAAAEPRAEGDVVVVERDIPQSTAIFGHAGIRRDDPDYYAARVVNYVLGGGSFASRLYEEVREKRGLAYSVYSFLQPLDHGAMILGGVATQNGRIGESLDLIRAEWKRMAEAGPTAEELKDAKTYLTGSFPLRLSSTGRIARMMVGIQLQELGIDYLDRQKELIEAVTPEDAKRVARRLFDPEALTVVVVGQPDGVEATREAPPDNS